MAQYKRNFYSSTLYGRIKAFYGEYTTEVFDALEPFTEGISGKIFALLPTSQYQANGQEFLINENLDWKKRGSYLYTNTPLSPLSFEGTGDGIAIQVQLQNKTSQQINLVLYKDELVDGKYDWVEKEKITDSNFSVVSPGSIKDVKFKLHGYGDYKVTIEAATNSTEVVIVGAKIRTSGVGLEVRTSKDLKTWSNWSRIDLHHTHIKGNSYEVTGESAEKYTDIRYIQGKLTLLSSDNKNSLVIDRIELRSDDSGLYEHDGEFTSKIDMGLVAQTKSKTFKEVNTIKWLETGAIGTELTMRSSSSRDNLFWGAITAPYRKSTNRLRLKEGQNSHSITIGPLDESDKFAFARIKQIKEWATQSYYPLDAGNVQLSFVFSKTKTDHRNPLNLLQVIDSPMHQENKSISFGPQPYFLTIEMDRTNSSGTPVVDYIEVLQDIEYKEVAHIMSKDISAVDNKRTGIKTLQQLSDYKFTAPRATGHGSFNQDTIQKAQHEYLLEDNTRRPSDVILYLESEKDSAARTGRTLSLQDKVIAKVFNKVPENGDTTGVMTHYSYMAGTVQYLRPYDRELDSNFTPSLLSDKKYKYFITNGWPNTTHQVIQNQTLKDLSAMYNVVASSIKRSNPEMLYNEDGTLLQGQKLIMPNDTSNNKVSIQFANGTLYTEKSSHNAVYDKSNGKDVVDLSSEKIKVKATEIKDLGYVDWVSEEKIYRGVINPNDIREEFRRKQYNQNNSFSLDREHIVAGNDTWQNLAVRYDIEVTDLKTANGKVRELFEGLVLTIPPNIVLPVISPVAEFEGANPYQVSIVPDSVHKKDGQLIDESFIPVNWDGKHLPLAVEYRESEILRAELKRGTIKNGMDPLPLSDVSQIVSVASKVGAKKFHPWNGSFGDYKLTANYIDWSPSKAGSVEPNANEEYIVTYRRLEVDHATVHLDTDYFEKLGTDIVWRSPEVKVYDGICSPQVDFKMELPKYNMFEGYDASLENIGYVIEDNDLWVETKSIEENNKHYLTGSLNGADPSKNWHPTINTGFYYLKEQEYYMYSEVMRTVIDEKELPQVENIKYLNGPTGIGALLSPKSINLIKDSSFKDTVWTVSQKFFLS